jgi:hypothetical protein
MFDLAAMRQQTHIYIYNTTVSAQVSRPRIRVPSLTDFRGLRGVLGSPKHNYLLDWSHLGARMGCSGMLRHALEPLLE